jgi:hypothetical protein
VSVGGGRANTAGRAHLVRESDAKGIRLHIRWPLLFDLDLKGVDRVSLFEDLIALRSPFPLPVFPPVCMSQPLPGTRGECEGLGHDPWSTRAGIQAKSAPTPSFTPSLRTTG